MRIAPLLAVLLALAPLAAVPAGTDLHATWDARCRNCHGDAGAFARSTLRLDTAGRLAGRHHAAAELERFLHNHYLADDLVAPVTAMLAAQVATRPLYRERCAGCHGTAADFARQSLALRGGVPVGRASGRPLEESLRSHGQLSPQERAEMVRTLARVLQEVGAGP